MIRCQITIEFGENGYQFPKYFIMNPILTKTNIKNNIYFCVLTVANKNIAILNIFCIYYDVYKFLLNHTERLCNKI